MKTIEFNREDLYELTGLLISYGIDENDQRLINSARYIENALDLGDFDSAELDEFAENAKNEAQTIIIIK